MFDQYKLLHIDDSQLGYRVKFRYHVMKYCGADAHQRPMYRLVRQERTEAKALAYIQNHCKA